MSSIKWLEKPKQSEKFKWLEKLKGPDKLKGPEKLKGLKKLKASSLCSSSTFSAPTSRTTFKRLFFRTSTLMTSRACVWSVRLSETPSY